MCSGVFLRSCCLAAVLPLVACATTLEDGDTSRVALTWSGSYFGVIPSASGSGFATWLLLGDDGRYTLLEQIEHQGELVSEEVQGRFVWRDGDRTIELDNAAEGRRFAVGEGFVFQQGADPNDESMIEAYTLRQQTSFAGDGEELLVDPASIERAGEVVSFDGVWNAADEGSRKVAMTIDCATRQPGVDEIVHYPQTYGRGEPLPAGQEQGEEFATTILAEAVDFLCME